MRIGMIAPPWLAVPPVGYGGTEAVIDNLARGLSRRGHEVVLFSVGTSTCPVSIAWQYDRPVEPMGAGLPEAVHVMAAYKAFHDMDVIHDHTLLGPLLGPARMRPGIALVTTVHGEFTADVKVALADAARVATIVAISRNHRRTAPRGLVSAVIHHGVDLEQFRLGPGGGGYLLFVGRMSPAKGVHRAIRIARHANRTLVVVTKRWEPAEHEYFRSRVHPLLGPDVVLYGELSTAEEIQLLRHADALINPIRWPEPFGLVMAEALATGTPVLAFPEGAAPEIVDDGRTGYLRATEAELTAAVSRIPEINRSDCRASAVARFSSDRMARDYETLFLEVTGRSPSRTGSNEEEMARLFLGGRALVCGSAVERNRAGDSAQATGRKAATAAGSTARTFATSPAVTCRARTRAAASPA